MSRRRRPIAGKAALLALLCFAACTTPSPNARLPAELTGLRQAEILALLGEPDFRRSEPPAELWQYRAADCVLDLFFYGGSDGLRVTTAETRGGVSAVGACPEGEAPFRARLSRNGL
jgi:hypothetical protein